MFYNHICGHSIFRILIYYCVSAIEVDKRTLHSVIRKCIRLSIWQGQKQICLSHQCMWPQSSNATRPKYGRPVVSFSHTAATGVYLHTSPPVTLIKIDLTALTGMHRYWFIDVCHHKAHTLRARKLLQSPANSSRQRHKDNRPAATQRGWIWRLLSRQIQLTWSHWNHHSFTVSHYKLMCTHTHRGTHTILWLFSAKFEALANDSHACKLK